MSEPVLIPREVIPPPWRHVTTWGVGGLFQVGFAEDSDLLLVLSTAGRGIFNCLTGEKLARDYAEAHDFFNPIKLIAEGFGPLEGTRVRMAGLFGGGLPTTTLDGWAVEAQTRHWPTTTIFITGPYETLMTAKVLDVPISDDGPCTLRAYGFSDTGRSFVIASSCRLEIYGRS